MFAAERWITVYDWFLMDVAGNANTTGSGVGGPRIIPSLRWWIGGLLFASTAINYIDRQTLSLLAPYL